MLIRFLLLLSRQGKVRLVKWYTTVLQKEKQRTIRELTAVVLLRRGKMLNVLEFRDAKIVYRRYALLFFVVGVLDTENELLTLETVHRFVEQMDRAYGNVCELDIIFNFERAYHILDELVLDGVVQESSKREGLRRVQAADELEGMEGMESVMS